MQAIVLRRRDLGESDRRLSLLTREVGKLEVVAKGSRKAGARLAGASEPLAHCRYQIASGRRWGYVTQAQTLSSFAGLRADFERMSCALTLAEAFDALMPDGLADEAAYDLAVESLELIAGSGEPMAALLWAEVRLMAQQGFAVSWAHCVESGEPVAVDPAWVSPSAGGYLGEAHAEAAPDRFRAEASSLIALHKIGFVEAPPARVAGAGACFALLVRFMEAYAHRPLPAHRQAAQSWLPGSVLMSP